MVKSVYSQLKRSVDATQALSETEVLVLKFTLGLLIYPYTRKELRGYCETEKNRNKGRAQEGQSTQAFQVFLPVD